ncbi:MAG: MFS transporter [Chloroflexota bacterium]|nr:MFS transporter [Chloroflexota bacterium]
MSNKETTTGRSSGIFYGWWIVIASMCALVIGSAFYWQGFGVFFLSLQEEFDTNRAAISGAIALSQLEGGMLGPVGGYLVDRFGPRRMMTIGVVTMGAGFILLSTVNSLVMFYVVFLGVISVGMSVGVRVPALVAPANWFVRKRGLAIGISLTGSGFGGLFIPVLGILIATIGWRDTAIVAGLTVWALGIPLAIILRTRPEDHGMLPDGDPPRERPTPATTGAGHATASPAAAPDHLEGDYTLRGALRLPVFWFLAVAFGLRQFAVGAISLHVVPFLVDTGRSLEVASTILAATTTASVVGRLGFGWLADRFPPRYIMAVSMVMVGVGALILTNVGAGWTLLVLYIAVYAVGWGGGAVTMNATRGAYFGRRAFGTISGTMDFVQMFGLVLGPIYAGIVYDVTESYTIAFMSFAVSAAASGILMVFLRPPRRAAPSRPAASDAGVRES